MTNPGQGDCEHQRPEPANALWVVEELCNLAATIQEPLLTHWWTLGKPAHFILKPWVVICKMALQLAVNFSLT
jgi:hypothetical protein